MSLGTKHYTILFNCQGFENKRSKLGTNGKIVLKQFYFRTNFFIAFAISKYPNASSMVG